MITSVFKDFILHKEVSEVSINKFKDKVPEQLIKAWREYGFGSILNGYLKIVNPEEFQSLLEDVYARSKNSVVLFATSMGDLIIWEDNKYLLLLNFRRGTMKGISSGFDYFFEDLEDVSTLEKDLDWLPYPVAIKRYASLLFDECYGYVPILGLGGEEKVDNLKKVKLIEHIYLIAQFMGPIE